MLHRLTVRQLKMTFLCSSIWLGGRKAGMWRHTDTTCMARDWSRWLDKGPVVVGDAWLRLD